MLPAELPGWDACPIQTTSSQMLQGTGALKLYFLPSIFGSFFHCIQNILQKVHGLDGSRVRWDIAIPNFSFNIPYLQKPSSKALLLTSSLIWFIHCVFLCGQVLQCPAPTFICFFSALWSISSNVGDQEELQHRAVVWQHQGWRRKKFAYVLLPGRCFSLGIAGKVVVLQKAGSD